MNIGRNRLVVLGRSALFAAALASLSCAAMAAPARPADDGLVLATLPAARAGASPELRAAEAALAGDPRNLDLALRVAGLAIEQGRAWSDPRLYGRAQAALAPWWANPDPPERVRVLRAVILQAAHDFAAALADLDAILARSPGNAQARLTRAFVRLVVGDVAGAAEDCRSLPVSVGLLPAAACMGRVDHLTGAASRGSERLKRLLADSAPANEAMRKFAYAILADLAASQGSGSEAERYFTEAMTAGTPDVPLLARYADLLLDAGRAGEVLTLLDGKGDADVLMLRQAIAAKRTGDPRLAGWAAILNERFAAAKAGGVRLHLREEARFRLDVEADAAAALVLAVHNWAVQKEPEDARLLFESALAANDPAAAADATRFVRRVGLSDRRLTPLIARLEPVLK
ncbi:MAG: hypothetical protein ACT4SY_14420 [Hyphomicrobiales bacterium]